MFSYCFHFDSFAHLALVFNQKTEEECGKEKDPHLVPQAIAIYSHGSPLSCYFRLAQANKTSNL